MTNSVRMKTRIWVNINMRAKKNRKREMFYRRIAAKVQSAEFFEKSGVKKPTEDIF